MCAQNYAISGLTHNCEKACDPMYNTISEKHNALRQILLYYHLKKTLRSDLVAPVDPSALHEVQVKNLPVFCLVCILYSFFSGCSSFD
jgi:hypothetical protein